jgi:hypothetical protein
MSLAEFQRALADLTASPAMVRSIRTDPSPPLARYTLTPRESARLAAIANSRGMAANCMLYRANRLAPIALNCPETCTALGDRLEPLLCDFWAAEPTTDVNFLVETDRFCRFLWARADLPESLAATLRPEHAVVVARLDATRRMAGTSAFTTAGPGRPTSLARTRRQTVRTLSS